MISIVKRENYHSEEEYKEAYQQMLEMIKEHEESYKDSEEFDPNYKGNYLKSLNIVYNEHPSFKIED